MPWEALLVCLIAILVIVSFVAEKVPPDVTALGLFAVLLGLGALFPASKLPSVKDLLAVFAAEAPLTIMAMFILNVALEKCGLIEKLAEKMGLLTGLSYPYFIFIFIIVVGAFSTVMNNTAVVMILLPVALSLSRKAKINPSKILIPLSYASIFGGCCTLIGTSTNILASNIATNYGLKPISMFELGAVGVPLMLVSGLYIALFGRKLLPDRESMYSLLPKESLKEFIVEALIRPNSPLIGSSFEESALAKKKGIRLIELIRKGKPLQFGIQSLPLQADDRLVFSCHTNAIGQARSTKGLEIYSLDEEGLEKISLDEASVVEAIIPPTSNLVGQSLQGVHLFRQFRVMLIAVHRKGMNLRAQSSSAHIKSGDTLLLMGTDMAIEALRASSNMIVLDNSRQPAKNMETRAPFVVMTIFGVIVLSAINLLPIVVGALMGAALLIVTGCVKPRDAYNAIEWRILVIIYSSLALGLAMEASGLASFIGGQISSLAFDHVSAGARAFTLFAAVYLATALLTEILSNNASVVIMTPIAINIALSIGVDPRPFVIATCIGASNAFATPIGYQTNTYVYTVGGYRFTDFVKIGICINLLYLIGVLWIVPKVWPF
jgi:di/tricarboxylate transporter